MSSDEKPTIGDELRRKYHEEQAGQRKPKPAEPRDWQSRIEEEIAKIDFDSLSNKGKPLNLNRNPYVREEDELANSLIRNAGFTLPWIEDGKKIDAQIEAARAGLKRARDGHLQMRDAEINADRQSVESAWQLALREFRQQVERINRDIRDYNLKAPNMAVHKFSLRVGEELARLGIEEGVMSDE